MSKIRYGRLLRLAAFLDKLKPRKFDFCTVIRGRPRCGTVGCAMGWTPKIWPKLVEWDKNEFGELTGIKFCDSKKYKDTETIIHELFCIDYDDINYLFFPNSDHPAYWQSGQGCGKDATAKEVAESIRQFVKYKKSHA